MVKAKIPVVIPPFTGIDGKFTCIGSGLLYEGHGRETPESLMMLLTPSGTGEPISDRARPKAWWIAQAVFYDLPHNKSSSITDVRAKLENAIRAKTLVFPAHIKQLENKTNKEFNKLNLEVSEKTAQSGQAGHSKMTKGKGKEKEEKALKPKPKTTKTATVTRPKDAPVEEPTTFATTTIFSTNTPATERTKQTARKSTGGKRPRARSPADEAAPSTKKAKTSKAGPSDSERMEIEPSPDDPVSGSWDVSCKEVAQGWELYSDDQFSLTVVRTQNGSVEGTFDFGIAHGFFRAKKVETNVDGTVRVTFEWVGQESEGMILTPSKNQTGWVKFSKNAKGVPTCKGKIKCLPACGEKGVDFSGTWYAPPGPINVGWSDYDEEAYERANRARWY